MPSVKIPKKSTDNDMTPFVDIAFLILSFFIMATKMKPPEKVEIATPSSVSTDKLPENDALLVEMDKSGRVFFTMLAEANPDAKKYVIERISSQRGLGLTDVHVQAYIKEHSVGVPFSQLKAYLELPENQRKEFKEPGIPVDSAKNELYDWINAGVRGFQGRRINYMIKGDNQSKYPHFKQVLEAFKKNDIFKFQLVTTPEDAPVGSDLYRKRATGSSEPAAK